MSSSATSLHETALDGLLNLNSLFMIAVFLRLSLTMSGQCSLENLSACNANIDVAKNVLVFEVVSFSFFLFSSLVAQRLKLEINVLNSKDVDNVFWADINLRVLRFGILASAVGSVVGCLFLMLSMVCMIEIRPGMVSRGSKLATHGVTAFVVLRPFRMHTWRTIGELTLPSFSFFIEMRKKTKVGPFQFSGWAKIKMALKYSSTQCTNKHHLPHYALKEMVLDCPLVIAS